MRANPLATFKCYSCPSRRGVLAAWPAAWLAACGPRRDPGALRVWAMGYEGDYAPHLMPGFTRATGIAVEVQSLPWTAAHEKLLTAFAGDALPDVMMLPNGWIGEFAMIGAIAPVADPALVAGVFPAVRETTRYRGRDHAVPWSVAPQMQFYRTDLVRAAGYAAPPPDWAGWRTMAWAIKRRRPDGYALLSYLNWPETLFTFAGQTGAALLREEGTRGAFDTPAFRAALGFYASLFAEGLAPRALSTELQDPLAAFARGDFAIYPRDPTLLLDLHRRRAEIAPGRWSVARMPGPKGPGAVTAASASLAVATTTRHPAGAWALVRHMTTAGSELRFQRLIGNLPARMDAWRDPSLATPLIAPFAAQVRDAAIMPAVAEWPRIQSEVQLIAERVVRGALSVPAGTRAMDARVDTLLARRRALVQAGRLA